LYDLEGNYVGMEEVGLESPLLDPIDLIVLFGGLLRGIGKGVSSIAARATSRASVVIGGRTLSVAVTGAMRTAFRRLSIQNLKFTTTTAARMATRGVTCPCTFFTSGLSMTDEAQTLKGFRARSFTQSRC
jgi:hypothetical protein